MRESSAVPSTEPVKGYSRSALVGGLLETDHESELRGWIVTRPSESKEDAGRLEDGREMKPCEGFDKCNCGCMPLMWTLPVETINPIRTRRVDDSRTTLVNSSPSSECKPSAPMSALGSDTVPLESRGVSSETVETTPLLGVDPIQEFLKDCELEALP